MEERWKDGRSACWGSLRYEEYEAGNWSKLTGSPAEREAAKSNVQKVPFGFSDHLSPLVPASLLVIVPIRLRVSVSQELAPHWRSPSSKWWSKVKQCLTFWFTGLCSRTLRSQQWHVCHPSADEQCQSLGIAVIKPCR